MSQSSLPFDVYLEHGSRYCFANAIDWPGWCRKGRDSFAALNALFSYGPRYQGALAEAGLNVELPGSSSDLRVVEELSGDATTDFGAPGKPPSADSRSIDPGELARQMRILEACWSAFGQAVESAHGIRLRKGPRGGGRDLPQIIEHVLDANLAYLSRLAWKPGLDPSATPVAGLAKTLDATRQALSAAVSGNLPEQGPRGGKLWKPRYFVRRIAWHILDHAWEIEDRLV